MSADEAKFVEELTDQTDSFSRWYTEVILKAELADHGTLPPLVVRLQGVLASAQAGRGLSSAPTSWRKRCSYGGTIGAAGLYPLFQIPGAYQGFCTIERSYGMLDRGDSYDQTQTDSTFVNDPGDNVCIRPRS